ncbi:hypothetical protein [Aureimonas glaciei]|uniref:hypothetical protein n=1 Tax=Aureimonas glaciei TaxID=1776957 RepID=UPI00166B92F8|nr:hypothetical protein [Aureimonas glaciei]
MDLTLLPRSIGRAHSVLVGRAAWPAQASAQVYGHLNAPDDPFSRVDVITSVQRR